MTPRVIICMSDEGQDPTETSTPWSIFKAASFSVDFATATGIVAQCDPLMTSRNSLLRKTMGATCAQLDLHDKMIEDPAYKSPKAWEKDGFTLLDYDIVLLPGGHDKPIRKYLESQTLHKLVAEYFPHTKRGNPEAKVLGAICHGVLVLANTKYPDGKSVLHDVKTTTLTAGLEGLAYQTSRLFKGDYYLTYGVDGKRTEAQVLDVLDDPANQYKSASPLTSSFIVEDDTHYYVSGRYPPDSKEFAEAMILMVKEIKQTGP